MIPVNFQPTLHDDLWTNGKLTRPAVVILGISWSQSKKLPFGISTSACQKKSCKSKNKDQMSMSIFPPPPRIKRSIFACGGKKEDKKIFCVTRLQLLVKVGWTNSSTIPKEGSLSKIHIHKLYIQVTFVVRTFDLKRLQLLLKKQNELVGSYCWWKESG